VTAAEVDGLAAHVMPAALHAARLLPVTLICPFLGGPAVAPVVKVALATALGAAAYAGAGAPSTLSGLHFVAGVAREAAFGAVLAFVATVPFEAARAGGRIVDTLRGATLGELHVAPLRQRESASGDLLSHWTVLVAASVGGDRLVLRALLGTFEAVPVGSAATVSVSLEPVLHAGAEVLACAVALGAPAAAGLLAAEVAIAVAARASPLLGVAAVGQPARAAVGVLAIGLPAALLAGKLTATVATSAGLVRLCGGGLP
jgi:type III secretory pathway component EscT